MKLTAMQERVWYAIGWSLFGLSLGSILAAVLLAVVTRQPLELIFGLVGVANAFSCWRQLKRGPL